MKNSLVCFAALALAAFCGCTTAPEPPKTPDEAVDAFLRDYVGVQFGDDIAKINGFEDNQYKLPMKKPFHHFTHASCYYRKGKLYRVNIWADIGQEYSFTSTAPQIRSALCSMAEQMGLPRSYFANHRHDEFPVWEGISLPNEPTALEYRIESGCRDYVNFRRYVVDIVDMKLDAETSSGKIKGPNYPANRKALRLSWGIPLPPAE